MNRIALCEVYIHVVSTKNYTTKKKEKEKKNFIKSSGHFHHKARTK